MRCFSAKLETVGVILSLASLLAAFGVASSADARPKEKKTKSSSVESQTLSEVENWLRAASQAERSAEFSATVDLQRDGAPLTRWRLWRNGNKERMEYVAPPVRKGDLLVDDGQNVWLYHRADNTAIQTKSRPRSLDFESLSARGLQTRLGDDQKIDEREARVLEVRRGNGRVVRRLFVDEKTRVLLGHQTFANGKSVERMTFGDLKTGDVADSRFRWNPPQGAQIVRSAGRVYLQLAPARRAAKWLRVPNYLPSGFAFESAIVDGEKGEAWLRYVSTISRLSLFQQRADASAQSAPSRVDGGWFWQSGNNRFLLAGAPTDEVQNIIKSLK